MQLTLEVKNAHMIQMPGESFSIASEDGGATFIFRGDLAKQLRDKYAEQKQKSKWDMRVQVNIEVAEPTGVKL